MGAGGFGDAGGPLPRPHGRDLRPARRRAQHEGRSGEPVHARGARRRPAPDHRGARRRPGRHLRQQRRRGERARARGDASGAGPDARRARAAAGLDPARSRGRAGRSRRPSTTPTSASGFGAGMAQFIVAVSHQGPITAEFAAQPAPDPAMFGMPAEDDGTRTDAAARPEHRLLHALRARLRRAARRVRRGSSSPPAWSPRARWPTAAAHAVAERLGTDGRALPERPRRLPRRRVRPDRRPGRVRREAARGARRGLRHGGRPAG